MLALVLENMTHQIKIKDLQSWIKDEQLILFASSSKENKRLYATLRGSYEVHHKGKKVWEGIQPFDAVEKYNDI